MALIEFIFKDGYHFFGTAFLIIIVLEGIASIVKAFRK